MITVLIELLKILQERLGAAQKRKSTNSDRLFREVVGPSFEMLKTIHDDYQRSMSDLVRHLRAKILPPRQLIEWFRECGLKYRTDRAALWTIDNELRGINVNVFSGNGKPPEIADSFRRYVKAVLEYAMVVTGPNEVSFYREYEEHLSRLFRRAEAMSPRGGQEHDDLVVQLFYSTDYVIDMNEVLINLVDDVLPRRWGEVAGAFRLIRSSLGYPSLT